MVSLVDALERVASLSFETRYYKRWLTNERALVFVLERTTETYRTLLYDRASGTSSVWRDGDGHRPRARTMPIRYFGVDGTLQGEEIVFVPPTVRLSPDRKWICWWGVADDWVVLNTVRTEVVHRTREEHLGLSGDVVWFADASRWAEPFSSRTFKSFVELDVYTRGQSAPNARDVKNLRRGECVGTTQQGIGLFIHPKRNGRAVAPDTASAVEITHVDLNRDELQGVRRKTNLPTGFTCGSACVAPEREHLAWLLDRREGSESVQGLWITDLYGREISPVRILERKVLESVAPSRTSEQARIGDLEWLPDESGISFVYGDHILNCAVS